MRTKPLILCEIDWLLVYVWDLEKIRVLAEIIYWAGQSVALRV